MNALVNRGSGTEWPVLVGNPIVTDVYTSDPVVLVHDGVAYL